MPNKQNTQRIISAIKITRKQRSLSDGSSGLNVSDQNELNESLEYLDRLKGKDFIDSIIEIKDHLYFP